MWDERREALAKGGGEGRTMVTDGSDGSIAVETGGTEGRPLVGALGVVTCDVEGDRPGD